MNIKSKVEFCAKPCCNGEDGAPGRNGADVSSKETLHEPLLLNVLAKSEFEVEQPETNDKTKDTASTTAGSTGNPNELIIGASLMLLSAAILSISSLLVKQVESNGVHAFQIIAMRCFGQLFIVNGCLALKRVPLRLWFGKKENYKLLATRGIGSICAYSLYFFTLSILSLSDATALWFTTPMFTGVIAYLVLREDFGIVESMTTVIAIIGILFIVRPSAFFGATESKVNHDVKGSTTSHIIGVSAVLFSAMLMGVSLTVMRKLGKREHFLVQVNWFSAAGVVVGPVGGAIVGFVMPNSIDWGKIAILTILGSLGQMSVTYSLKLIPAVIASNIRNTDVIFSFMWDVLILGHAISYLTIIGAILILSSSFIISLNRFRKQKNLKKEEEKQLKEDAGRVSLVVQ